MSIVTLPRLDVTRLAADFSQSVREALTANQMAKVRRGDAIADDYTDVGGWMAEAIYLQHPHAESIEDYDDEMTLALERAEAANWHLSRILVACEFSRTVASAFEARGHSVLSCDVLPAEAPGPHYQGDVREILNDGWHMAIMHPPCTYIAACQLWRCQPKHDPSREREALRQDSLEFVRTLAAAPIARKCIENPKSCIGTENAAPGFLPQMVQPYEYGHDHSKQTYLWRHELPELVADPDDYIEPRIVTNNNGRKVPRWANQCDGSGADRMGPSDDRGHKRSGFFSGIAEAMAEQWGGIKEALTAPANAEPVGQLALF